MIQVILFHSVSIGKSKINNWDGVIIKNFKFDIHIFQCLNIVLLTLNIRHSTNVILLNLHLNEA